MPVHTCYLAQVANKKGIFQCYGGVQVVKNKQALDETSAQHELHIGDHHLKCTEVSPERQLSCQSFGGGMHQTGFVSRDHTCAGDVYTIGDNTYRLCERKKST
jgi:hypothetical protein